MVDVGLLKESFPLLKASVYCLLKTSKFPSLFRLVGMLQGTVEAFTSRGPNDMHIVKLAAIICKELRKVN